GPTAKFEPDAGAQETATLPSTTSDAEALKVTVAPLALEAGTVKSRGSASAGAVVSTTFTSNEPLPPFEPRQFTVVLPRANREPDAGEQVALSMGRPFSSSPEPVAPALYVTIAPPEPVASTVWFCGSWSAANALTVSERKTQTHSTRERDTDAPPAKQIYGDVRILTPSSGSDQYHVTVW